MKLFFADTGKDFPQMIEHINLVDKYIQEKYNMKITRIKAEKSFDYYMFEHEKTKGKNKGKKGYGWATMLCRWCTSNLKNRVIDNYLKRYKEEGYTEYIGIAYDEPKRIKDKRYPLVEYEMTEADCLQYCYEKGFNWDGLYEHFDRVSCWCCPLKNLKELKILYTHYPELWKKLKEMDKKSYNQFRADYSVEELEKKFKIDEYFKICFPKEKNGSKLYKEFVSYFSDDSIEQLEEKIKKEGD